MPTSKRERQRAARQARREAELAAQRRAARRRQIILTTVAVVGIVGLLFLFNVIGGDDSENVATDETTTTAKTAEAQCPPAGGSAERKTTFESPPPMCIDADKSYKAKVETDVGEFVIELEPKAAPKTVNNFVVLARYHYFDGIVFHRVVKDFVVQGGDPEGTGSGGPGYQFEDENLADTTYEEAVVAMANSGANTNGSQFFVVVSENGAKTLIEAQADKQPHYTRFGKVVEGFDVVKKIEADGSDEGPPAVQHRMTRVTIEES